MFQQIIKLAFSKWFANIQQVEYLNGFYKQGIINRVSFVPFSEEVVDILTVWRGTIYFNPSSYEESMLREELAQAARGFAALFDDKILN